MKMDYFGWSITLEPGFMLLIGDTPEAHIQLKGAYGRGTRVSLQISANGARTEGILTEYSASYGTCVNGTKIQKSARIKDHDFISIGDFTAYYNRGKLYFDYGSIRTNGVEVRPESLDIQTTYPVFIRNTRIQVKRDDTPIEILDPSSIPTKPELNIVTSLMPSIVMFCLVVLLRGVMSTSNGAFVAFSICSMGVGVCTSVFSLINRQKKYKKDVAKRRSTYLEYIDKKRKEIEAARREELDCLNEQYYSTTQDLAHIESFDSKLFDRIPTDPDFLELYLGRGNVEALRRIDYKKQEKLEIGDDLCSLPEHVAGEYRDIGDAPVVMSLRDANAVGIVGNEDALYSMMKNMIVDIISRQYYGDISIYALIGEDTEKYKWLRGLKALQTAGGGRNIVCDQESKNRVFENLYKELTLRQEEKVHGRFNIVFVMEDHGIKSHPISKFIEHASELDTVFLFFESKLPLLPLYCSRIIDIFDHESAMLYDSQNKMEKKYFEYESVSDDRLQNAVQILAPVECEEISLAGTLRKNISLFELLGINSVAGLNLSERWHASKIYETMAVPLGVNVKNETVYLDLHEKYHGPHGLVAGTTGSGKSEILQTFILGAATLFHPYEIGFVIIDFKGGGMVNQFKELPHLIGAITNIDGKAIERSLKSIKAELLKRQNLFAEQNVNHIDKYIKAYKEGKAAVALPHLVIIVDEFAELKAEQPEFMKELISAARIGRSLGVHLILATQKPAGQVNEQIWSNSKFKLCLKVQTQEDSNEVLKSPLAAEIREPGRAYLQVGNNEMFELLQSGYSGSPEKSDMGNQKSFDIYELDFKGNRKLVYRQRPQKTTSSRTQLEAIVSYVHDYCDKMQIKKLPEICLPPLSNLITFDNEQYENMKNPDMSITIGVYDDPDHQIQEKATVNIGTSNTMIIGSSQYGKTNLIEDLIRGLAENYTPKDVNLYIVDFASMVLRNFEGMAHVGGVVCPSDDEKLKNLFKYLNDQINLRREAILAVGVSSFIAYREAGYTDFPQIILFIDNFTALKDLYLQDNDILLTLCREGVSVGITVVIANSQTSGLGYKYMSNFATRISLFCNEPSEYSSVFGACRMRPDEVPGRCLVEVDKTIYECQTFMAFEGEREIERVQKMQKFVVDINKQYKGMRANPIPEIPVLLGETYISDNFIGTYDDKKQIIGISYDTVAPVFYEIQKNNLLAICGGDNSGKSNFIRYITHMMQRTYSDIEIFVMDNYKKKLESLRKNCSVYDVSGEQCKDVLINLDVYLHNKYQQLVAGDDVNSAWKLLIINNEDVFQTISGDKAALAAFKNIIGKYKMLNVLVVLGNVPNAQVVYGAPEIYKIVKESRNILLFDNLDNCKIVDVSLTIVRRNKKKVETGDAFYLVGNECIKVKTPIAIQ
jgi:S-DNA-T family DNA segregation ATPase FtsK/SpoIIIE